MIKNINFEFEEGDLVSLKTDIENYPFIITAYYIKGGVTLYDLSSDSGYKGFHSGYEFEKWDGMINIIKQN